MILCDTRQEADMLCRLIGAALAQGGLANAPSVVEMIRRITIKTPVEEKADKVPEEKKLE